jgi:hypothetical protein
MENNPANYLSHLRAPAGCGTLRRLADPRGNPIVRYLLVIFLIFALGAASCPFALSGLWTRRWFRICWYLTMFILVSGFIRSR